MRYSGLPVLLFLMASTQVIDAQAQSTSEQMRYAQQRQKWRSQEIHNDVQSHMDEVRKRLDESKARMHQNGYKSYSGSSVSSSSSPNSSYGQHSGLSAPTLAGHNFSPPRINEISTYPGHPDYKETSSSPNAAFGSIASMRFVTTDQPRRVYDFYTKDLQAHGWKFNKSKCSDHSLSASHEKANRSVSISYKAVPGGTQVDLSYSKDKLFTQSNDPLKYMIKTSDMSNLGNNERVKMNNSAFPGMILPGANLDNNERIRRGLK
ncbi:MAG: hypothetical protein SFY67_09385 [Candidatus Melainabacteria bacterium]|nr:hypothetical protein [Candidatus Melainabacteria bacterium]